MAGRRASLSGRGRIRTRHPSPPLFASAICLRCSLLSPAACHHPPPAITRRPLPPPPLLVTPVAVCLPAAVAFPLPVITRRPLPPLLTASSQPASPLSVAFPRLSLLPAARRLPPSSFPCLSSSAVACTPAASHPPYQLPATPPPVSPPPVSPPPATSATAACHPCRCLPPRCLSLFPACYHPPPAACRPLPPPLSASPLLPAVPPLLTSRTRCLPFPPPCAGRADRWAAAAPRVVGRGAMRRRREVLRNNLENRKILPIFVSVKYRGSGLSRPGFLFFIGLSFLWQKRLSI